MNPKMNSASTSLLAFCASVLAIVSVDAQEHVDVPLPPYDPPPTVPHHSQSRSEKPASQDATVNHPHTGSAASKRTTKQGYLSRNQKPAKPKYVQSVRHRNRGRHASFWPWQHSKQKLEKSSAKDHSGRRKGLAANSKIRS
jgi:hypothetical protein